MGLRFLLVPPLENMDNRPPAINRSYLLCLILFTLGIFLMSAGFGLSLGQSDLIANIAIQTPIFKAPLSDAPLSGSQVLELINKEREKENLQPLKRDPGLDFVAYIRAKNIMANGDFSHEATKSAGLIYTSVADRLLIQYKNIGENLALGNFDGEEKTLVKAWMDSPGHREVILGNYSKAGIYILLGKFNGVQTEVTVLIAAK